ncbi:MAG TPA: NifU family protein [Armatimonadota bacterium]
MITVTELAQQHVREALAEVGESVAGLRVIALARGQYRLDLVEKGQERKDDVTQEYDGFLVYLDPHSAEALSTATLDYVETQAGAGFQIDNPPDEAGRPESGPDQEIWDKVQALLESSVNPSVAQHGGHISLMEVTDGQVYLAMGGGCQGCGRAQATLRNGVETLLKQEIPELKAVLDVTDHAGGRNPYYS